MAGRSGRPNLPARAAEKRKFAALYSGESGFPDGICEKQVVK